MEPDAAAPLQAADAEAPAPAPSEESAPAAAAEAAAQENAFMNAIIRGATADVVAAGASKPDDAGADEFEPEAADGASAAPGQQPDAGVKPSSARLTRRGAAAEIERLNARIAELESGTAPPVPPDASEQERQAILDAEDRYRRLLAKPDDDPDWSQDDYVWLQDEKRKRALLPDVTRHYETVIERERRLAQASVEQERQAFWASVGQDLASAAELPGVDLEALKKAPTFADRDRMVYAAATARRDGEIKALREELADAKRQLLGIVRPPLNGGRSAPGRTYDENGFMNGLIRGAV